MRSLPQFWFRLTHWYAASRGWNTSTELVATSPSMSPPLRPSARTMSPAAMID